MRFSIYLTAIVLISNLMICSDGFSQQKRPLQPNTSYERVCYINHILLRKQFTALQNEHADYKVKWDKETKAKSDSLKQTEPVFKERLYKDSITGGFNRKQIQSEAETKRTQLNNQHNSNIRAVHAAHVSRMKELEKKIQLAIKQVMLEKGYTKIKSVQGVSSTDKNDITQLVLQKLQ